MRRSRRRAPGGAAPSRQPPAGQPGRCGAPRCFTVNCYSWTTWRRFLPPARSPLPPGRGRCRSVTFGSTEGALASPGRGFPAFSAPVAEAGLCCAYSRRGPPPRGLSRGPPPGPAAVLPEAPDRKPAGSSPLLPNSPCRFFVPSTPVWGVVLFLSVNRPKNREGTNISDLIKFNQPLTLVVIKAELHTIGTASPSEHYDPITCGYIQISPSSGGGAKQRGLQKNPPRHNLKRRCQKKPQKTK